MKERGEAWGLEEWHGEYRRTRDLSQVVFFAPILQCKISVKQRQQPGIDVDLNCKGNGDDAIVSTLQAGQPGQSTNVMMSSGTTGGLCPGIASRVKPSSTILPLDRTCIIAYPNLDGIVNLDRHWSPR
jgi:hypothetical protein